MKKTLLGIIIIVGFNILIDPLEIDLITKCVMSGCVGLITALALFTED